MPTRARTHHTELIDHMTAEWQSIGRSPAAIGALARVARRDPTLSQLVLGTPRRPASCPTPLDLIDHLRRASGRRQREDAARMIRVLLREAGSDPFIGRMLVQALIPGLISVASALQWGVGGEWSDGDEFFAELITTTWLVVQEWAGQDRAYAVLDLLSAIRCRLRRQLLRSKEMGTRLSPIVSAGYDREAWTETDLEELARILINLHCEGMDHEEIQLLYAQHVLGYTIAELATTTGRERRALYSRTATAASDGSAPPPAEARAMTRAYGVPVASAGPEPTDALEGRRARRRPNWWVILAVSLALIALLVETSGRENPGRPLRVQSAASTPGSAPGAATRLHRSDGVATTSSTSTSTTAPAATTPLATPTPTIDTQRTGTNVAPAAPTTSTTTTSLFSTTTTIAAPPAALPADRTQTEGYLDPPQQDSGVFAVDGSGPTEISVVWSTPVYLTMTVTCPGASQTVGGTTAMETSIPDAGDGCKATVSEPSSESASLTYTVTIGPAGG